MLSVFSGPFRPFLEDSFVDRLTSLKSDPLAPVAVVAPSSKLRDYLQLLLARRGFSFLNIHFHTFSSLVETTLGHDNSLEKPVLSDPLFYDTLVKILLREKKPFKEFEEMAVPDGFPPAVRSTLRDLLDAGVDADLIKDAMRQEFVGRPVDLGTLRELLNLYRAYLEKLDSLPVSTNAQLMAKATELAPESKTLAGYKEIMFYGFYDLTGLQTELFLSIVKHQASSFFFPYVADHESYVFAKRFRDNVLQLAQFKEESSVETSKEIKPTIYNVSGSRDEAYLIGREILKLRKEGLSFDDMAVVSRSRVQLEGALPSLLREWKIPFSTTALAPISRQRPAKLVLDFLLLAASSAIPIKRFDFSSSDDWGRLDIETLFEKTRGWPRQALWSAYVKRLDTLLTEIVSPPTAQGKNLYEKIHGCIQSLSTFDILGTVSLDDFIDALRQRFEKTVSPDEESLKSGVSLLHAEAARGLSFKAVLLIGLEEKVFPRIIREDPFLRDDARIALRDTVGYKIGQKLSALEEERLLFHMLTQMGTEKSVFVYQRSDDEGKVVGESSFLRSWMAQHEWNVENGVQSIPRPTFEKLKSEKLDFLGKKETVMALLHKNHEKEAIDYLKSLGERTDSFLRGLVTQQQLHKFDAPTGLDGLVGPTDISQLTDHGRISPTALENYGRCPYQFFATKVLKLAPLEVRRDLFQMPPDKKGTAIHLFLETFFKEITSNGTCDVPKTIPATAFQTVFDETIPVTLGKDWDIPPILWSVLRMELREEIRTYLEKELPLLAELGLTPTYFELNWTGQLPAPLNDVTWVGQMDRVDLGQGKVVVVDYKTGKIPTRKIETESIRGRRMQPPLYLMMVNDFLKMKGHPALEFDFSYHQVGKKGERKTFSSDEWKGAQDMILETAAQQLALMSAGNFLIYPDTEPGSGDDRYCSSCDALDICRKSHSLSAYRARQGPGQQMTEIRTRKKPKAATKKKSHAQ